MIESEQELIRPKPSVIFPTITTWITGNRYGFMGDPHPTPQQRVWHRFSPGCFHDLFADDEAEWAGMGLCIIGNICKALGRDQISADADAKLELQIAPGSDAIPMPWPGMPDDRPIPLDITKLPLDSAMFIADDKTFKYRADRLALMRRIHFIWVPWLQGKLGVPSRYQRWL